MKKMTKKEMFAQILTHLTDENEINFINHEIELLENKASQTRKPSANQVANESFKETILQILNATDKALTITEIQESDESLALLTNQRISALLTQLVKTDKLVERVVDKRKAMFRAIGE